MKDEIRFFASGDNAFDIFSIDENEVWAAIFENAGKKQLFCSADQ